MKCPCIRSCWMRSIMMTSASATASSIDVVGVTPKRASSRGISVGGPHAHTSRAHRVEQQHVRSQDAAVQQVADDRDLQALEALLVLADRERVEQRLRRVLVHAVAGIDDGRPAQAREQVRGARRRVPHHDHVGRHRLEVADRVEQRLPLRSRSRWPPRCSACRRSGASRRSRTTSASACSARRTG